MKLNILDMQDAQMWARNRYAEAQEEIEREWTKPIDQTVRALVLNQMDDATKQVLRQQMPDEMDELEGKR